MKLKSILCAAIGVCMAFSAGCSNTSTTQAPTEAESENTKITVVLDWTPNTNHSGLYAALSEGYYDEAGLDVEIIQPPEDGAEALVASGRAQFGISFQDTMVAPLTASEEIDITAVAAIVQHNLSGIISRGDKGIDSFGKMAGHSYATWGLPIEQNIIKTCVEADGASFEDVELIESSVQDVMTALDTDMVDTVWVYEYWDVIAAQVANYDYNYIDFKTVDDSFDYYTPVLISSNNYLSENAQTAQAFIDATAKGYKFCAENPDKAAEILLAAAPELDEALVKASAAFMANEYLDENGTWGTIDPERWSKFYSWLYANGLTETDLGTTGLNLEFQSK